LFYTFSYPFLPARINKDTNFSSLRKKFNVAIPKEKFKRSPT
jgi:hypothetical protein